jgi:hypothetical protein
VFDMAYTLVRRARARKDVFAAHREHIYQRITPEPAYHRQVSIVYLGLATLSGLAALLAAGGTPLRLLGGVALRMLPVHGVPAPHRQRAGLPLGLRPVYLLEYAPC